MKLTGTGTAGHRRLPGRRLSRSLAVPGSAASDSDTVTVTPWRVTITVTHGPGDSPA